MQSIRSQVSQGSSRGYLWTGLTLDEGLCLRAFAIVMIMVHNYMHWLPGSPGENEFGFQADRVHLLMAGLREHPLDAIRLLAAYLGHYGVQIFFFLSGYGLTIKYGATAPSWLKFQIKRWKAFYPAILLSALAFLTYEGLRVGWGDVFPDHGLNLLRQMIGVSNFIPDNVYRPIGPWWFIGVILQFYLILPLLWRCVQRHGDKFLYLLLGVAWILQSLLGHILYTRFDLNINHTILGHIGICAMGIWFARRGEFSIRWWVIALSAVLFVAGNFNYVFWIPSRVMLLLFLIPLFRALADCLSRAKCGQGFLLLVGQLSVYLFLCNGYLRRPIVDFAKHEAHWWTSLWTCAVFVLITIAWAWLLAVLERRFFLVLSRPRN